MTGAPQPTFRRINHIGVMVEDLANAQHWLAEIFGMPLSRSVDLPGGVHGEFYRCGEIDIEVIRIGDADARAKRLRGTNVRIDHIAVEVDDLEGTLNRLSALGVKTTMPQPRLSGNVLSTWTAEETTGGISYQLMQFVEAPPAR